MKDMNQTESILLKVSREQKDAIITAARAANMNVSEYIRSRAISLPMVPYIVTFRSADGTLQTERFMATSEADVYRCYENIISVKPVVIISDAWKAEITAAEEERADYDATINSVRP
jgi:hypothetical protein